MKKRYAYWFVAGLLLAFAAGATWAAIDVVMRRIPEDRLAEAIEAARTATPAAPDEPVAVG